MEAKPLQDLMTQDIQRQRAEIEAAAQKEAERIEAEARQQGVQRRDQALKQVDAELAAMAQRARERAEAEAHMIVMTTKDTVADELLAEVERDLRGKADSPDFPQILEQLLAELMQEGPEEGVVLAPPAHVDRIRTWLDKNGYKSFSVEAAPRIRDGVAVQDKQGSYRVTNTLSTRFIKQKDALRRMCIDRLFGAQA